ncbi:cupin domain-containing protein [Arenibaculum pallidiluteum]|uniref:cupin domain-containing protein n=1 Tax=Arenibaculum pallidiluteum TaxID=2812559 RepID=UPI001A968EC0|nr:cupin domain-containing protein [Arenibaculum pallidiluteum]
MHHVLRAVDIRPMPAYPGHSAGFRRAPLVDRAAGAVHTGLSACRLEAGGHVDTHVQSFEEYFYITAGEPTLVLDGRAFPLVPGSCGVVPVGTSHAWLGPADGTAAWIDLSTPIPRGSGEPTDTFFLGPPRYAEREPLDIRDPRARHLFRMRNDDITLDKLKVGARVDAPTVSASMATALLAYSGIAVKMLVDQRLSAALATMFMVEYQPGGVAHPHDHPLEEAYVILEGEVEATADGATYVLGEGDVFWTGVGCIHGFVNRTQRTVRWLETSSPQPPARHSYRFSRDWEYLEAKLAAAGPPDRG